jgi:hypothetical protein
LICVNYLRVNCISICMHVLSLLLQTKQMRIAMVQIIYHQRNYLNRNSRLLFNLHSLNNLILRRAIILVVIRSPPKLMLRYKEQMWQLSRVEHKVWKCLDSFIDTIKKEVSNYQNWNKRIHCLFHSQLILRI